MAIEGGNRESLVKIMARELDCEEVTYKDWDNESGADFVAVMLLVNFGRSGAFALKSPILDPKVVEMGMNINEHPIDGNVIQVLFVREPVQ